MTWAVSARYEIVIVLPDNARYADVLQDNARYEIVLPDNEKILTCGVACYHPLDPPLSQDPVVKAVMGEIAKGNISSANTPQIPREFKKTRLSPQGPMRSPF